MSKSFPRFVDRVTCWLGSPFAVVAAVGLVIAWLVGIPFTGLSDTYQLVINTTTTIITFLMVFVIQNSQNRNDKALHTKIDGMIAVLETDDRLKNIERMSEHEIDALHDQVASDDQG